MPLPTHEKGVLLEHCKVNKSLKVLLRVFKVAFLVQFIQE